MPRLSLIRFAPALLILVLLAAVNASVQADYSEDQLKADLKLLEDAKLPHGDKDFVIDPIRCDAGGEWPTVIGPWPPP